MPEPLTLPQLKALRSADYVAADYKNGEAQIRAILNAEHTSTGFDQTVTIACHDDSAEYGKHAMKGRTGFQGIHYSRTWETLIKHHLIKVGDTLGLAFRPDWTTTQCLTAARGDSSLMSTEDDREDRYGTLRYVGLHGDELALIIHRGEKRLEFVLCQTASPENTARMCSVSR